MSSTSALDEPGHRLVGDQQRGLGGERAGELELAQIDLGQARRNCRRARSRSRPARGSPSPRSRTCAAMRVLARAYSSGTQRFSSTDMLRNGRGIWKLRVMPRRHAPVRRQPGDVLALEHHAAAIAGQRARDAVDQRGLAGAVRADQADALALADLQADRVERGEAAEALAEARDVEDRAQPCAAQPSPAALDQPDDALRRHHDEHHQQHADDQDVDLGRDRHRGDLLDRAEQQRADHRAVPGRGAADHRHGDRIDRDHQVEGGQRVDVGDEERIGHACDRHESAHRGGRDQLEAQGRHARAFGGDLVVADRREAVADARDLEGARDRDREQREEQDQREQELDVAVEEQHASRASGCRRRWRRRHTPSC